MTFLVLLLSEAEKFRLFCFIFCMVNAILTGLSRSLDDSPKKQGVARVRFKIWLGVLPHSPKDVISQSGQKLKRIISWASPSPLMMRVDHYVAS